MGKRTFLKMMTAVAVIGLLTVLGVATQASAQGRGDPAVEHVIRVQEKFTELLITKEGVVGTAVGRNRAGALAVKVFVVDGADAAASPRGSMAYRSRCK